jgi:hypothetical protein
MKLESIFLKPNSGFSKTVEDWAKKLHVNVAEYDPRDSEMDTLIDGLVIFTENQNLNKESVDLRDNFDQRQRAVQKIDINGTMVASISNLTFWLDRNKCKNILIIGAENLLDNTNLNRLLTNIKTLKSH